MHTESTAPGLIHSMSQILGQSLFPVHRLDKATSGLLLIAKSSDMCSQLSQLFQARRIEKYYLAISDKKPKKKQGLVKGDMVQARGGSWMLTKTYHNPAVTQFFSHSLGEGRRLFVLKPHSGKTHQLRVALKSLSAAILGDQRYGAGGMDSRMFLHAYVLRFQLSGTEYTYVCEPEDEAFRAACALMPESYRKPWLLPWPTLPTQP